MREVDRLTTEKYGIPSILLMENAAHAAARVITEKLGGEIKGKSFLILCGKGNNGGDGAALARVLLNKKAKVHVVLMGAIEDVKGDAKTNFEIVQNLNKQAQISFHQVETKEQCTKIYEYYLQIPNRIDAIIDALFGTGLTRPLSELYSWAISSAYNYKIESPTTKTFSIDIPSGLNADSPLPLSDPFEADATITFTAAKIANIFPPALSFNGEVLVQNIGSPRDLIYQSPSKLFVSEKQDAIDWLYNTRFKSDSYKNKRGHALLIVGSKEYSGAAILAGNAAMLSGVGLTTVATSESARITVAAKMSEEVIVRDLPETESGAITKKAFAEVEKIIEKVDVIGIGCGLSSTEKTTKDFVREVVKKRVTPVVIDADALNALAPFDLKGSDELPLILTPHEGEFLRLLGTKDKSALKDRVKSARDFAEKHRVILVLKGERVLIAAPDGTVVINPTGNSGLGKAGNGDTLTGIITGFVAQAVQMKIDIYETVVAAVYISSLAGDIAARKFGKRFMLASDVRECLGEAFELLTKN